MSGYLYNTQYYCREQLMQELSNIILKEGKNLGKGILKVDSFLNHQLYPRLTLQMGKAFAKKFEAIGIEGADKIVTAEVSGIAPALATAMALNIPLIYARKKRPITMPSKTYQSNAPSHTKGGFTDLFISPEYLLAGDKVILIDDFLATGQTIKALTEIIMQAKADLLSIGVVIEKSFESGRDFLAELNVPIVSLALIESMQEENIVISL